MSARHFIFILVVFTYLIAGSMCINPNLVDKWNENSKSVKGAPINQETQQPGKDSKEPPTLAIGALIVAGISFSAGAALLLRMDYHKNLDTYASIQKSKLRSMALEQYRRDREEAMEQIENRFDKDELDKISNNKSNIETKTNQSIKSSDSVITNIIEESVDEEEKGSLEKYVDQYGKYVVGTAICILAVDVILRRLKR